MGLWLKSHYPDSELTLAVDARARELEGIDSIPPPPPKQGELTEWGVTFGVRPGAGHKTGFFCDQRDNRRLLATLVEGRRVLDLCCNTGGFTLVAGRHGAPKEVVGFDLDEDVVRLARENARRNRLAVRFEQGDLFDVLRSTPRGAADVIVLDPPKWADSPGEVDLALRKYGDANRLAMAVLEPGGLLLTCSCSGSVSEERFLACLAGAAAAAGADAQILFLRGAGPDHPVALECPETRYLKAVLLRMR
jgi:23S rRNA (cytosine1962-C5)-methyltransferase